MSVLDVILIGIALSVDACALTISNCTAYKNKLTRALEFSMPITFGIMQGVMPIIGFLIGSAFSGYVKNIGGYLTFAIFLILSIKILFDIIKEKKSGEEQKEGNFSYLVIFIQGIATSIDALIIGFSFSLELTFSIFIAVAIISSITFVLVLASLTFGKFLGKIVGKYASWVGAIILFALAIKSLVLAIIG